MVKIAWDARHQLPRGTKHYPARDAGLGLRRRPPFISATMEKLVVRSELPWLEVVPLSPVLVGNGSGDLAWYQPGSLVPGCQHRRSTQSSESGAGQLF